MSTEHPILAPGVAEGPEFTHVRTMFDDDRATAEIRAKITALDVGKCEGHFTAVSYTHLTLPTID